MYVIMITNRKFQEYGTESLSWQIRQIRAGKASRKELKMIKRSVFFAMAVLLMVCGLSVFAQEPNPESDFKVEVNNTGGLVITGYTGSRTDLVIPEEIQGLPVVRIGRRAFRNLSITSVVFPSTLSSIGDEAFSGSALTSITIPETITSLGDSSFANSKLLVSVTINMRAGNLIRTRLLFDSCNSLTTVNFPPNMIVIPSGMFRDCSSLTSITIPNGITDIGESAFDGTGLSSINLPEGVEKIYSRAFQDTKLTSVTLPSTIIEIRDFAFMNNPTLTEFIIPENLTRIKFGGLVFVNTNFDLRTKARLRQLGYSGSFLEEQF